MTKRIAIGWLGLDLAIFNVAIARSSPGVLQVDGRISYEGGTDHNLVATQIRGFEQGDVVPVSVESVPELSGVYRIADVSLEFGSGVNQIGWAPFSFTLEVITLGDFASMDSRIVGQPGLGTGWHGIPGSSTGYVGKVPVTTGIDSRSADGQVLRHRPNAPNDMHDYYASWKVPVADYYLGASRARFGSDRSVVTHHVEAIVEELQTVTPPSGAVGVRIDARGAAGGGYLETHKGRGGRTTAFVPLEAGDQLLVAVGRRGGTPNGGWPGGGDGGMSSTSDEHGYGGGGSSIVFVDPASEDQRQVVVAGGGGGMASKASAPSRAGDGGRIGTDASSPITGGRSAGVGGNPASADVDPGGDGLIFTGFAFGGEGASGIYPGGGGGGGGAYEGGATEFVPGHAEFVDALRNTELGLDISHTITDGAPMFQIDLSTGITDVELPPMGWSVRMSNTPPINANTPAAFNQFMDLPWDYPPGGFTLAENATLEQCEFSGDFVDLPYSTTYLAIGMYMSTGSTPGQVYFCWSTYALDRSAETISYIATYVVTANSGSVAGTIAGVARRTGMPLNETVTFAETPFWVYEAFEVTFMDANTTTFDFWSRPSGDPTDSYGEIVYRRVYRMEMLGFDGLSIEETDAGPFVHTADPQSLTFDAPSLGLSTPDPDVYAVVVLTIEYPDDDDGTRAYDATFIARYRPATGWSYANMVEVVMPSGSTAITEIIGAAVYSSTRFARSSEITESAAETTADFRAVLRSGGGGGAGNQYIAAGAGGGGGGLGPNPDISARNTDAQFWTGYQDGDGEVFLTWVMQNEAAAAQLYTPIGKQQAPNPYDWVLTNSIVECRPVERDDTLMLEMRAWEPGAQWFGHDGWTSWYRFTLVINDGGVAPVNAKIVNATLLRNAPEMTVIRCDVEYGFEGDYLALDIALRRGAEFVTCTLKSSASDDAQQWGWEATSMSGVTDEVVAYDDDSFICPDVDAYGSNQDYDDEGVTVTMWAADEDHEVAADWCFALADAGRASTIRFGLVQSAADLSALGDPPDWDSTDRATFRLLNHARWRSESYEITRPNR